MELMNAIRIHAYGDSTVLAYESIPTPDYGPDEVLIRVAATSVNPFDWAARSGYIVSYYPYTLPTVLGLDVSGVVEAVGSRVQGLEPGDEVYARSNPDRNGAYAEFIAIPASQVAHKPQSLDHLQAASIPHAALSAWRALIEVANLQAGKTVLIHAAAGGVGTIGVQLAKLQGATVIGTASASNQDFLRSLGVDQAIDYNATRFEEVVQNVDLVLDLVGDMGDNTQQRSWQVIKPGGMLASLVQFPSPEAAAAHGVKGEFVTSDVCDARTLIELSRLIDLGMIHPEVSYVYPLKDIRQAHELSESRHLRGKIGVQIAEL